MDSLSSHSFPANVLFKEPIVITHVMSIVFAFLLCYPLLLTQQIRRQKSCIIGSLLTLASIGFISGCFIQPTSQTVTTVIFQLLAFILLCLFCLQITLFAYRSNYFSQSKLSSLFRSNIPEWMDSLLGWTTLIVALSYLAVSAVVFTDSCTDDMLQSQCLAPLTMGSGFLIYGTCVLLHLLAIIKLPRLSTPEYYEGVIITFFGFTNLLFSGSPILGSAWRAINLGLLWFFGGLFSISASVQTWLPIIREKNIINSLIILLTGQGYCSTIVRGITHSGDPYTLEVHTMLGYILIIGAIARITQIAFRKSPVENLPHRMFQQTVDAMIDEVDIEDPDALSKGSIKCKHHFIFASITLVSGILASFLAITGGILFMGANIGWIRYMRYYIKDPSTYTNVILACAFLWCACVFGFCTLYKTLKMQDSSNLYDYLELPPVSSSPLEQARDDDDDEERRDWNYYEEPADISLLAISSPRSEVFDSSIIGSPTYAEPDFIRFNRADQEHNMTIEKTIRPSEYRAKRRSLLINNNNNTSMTILTKKQLTASFSVGGILPDEIVLGNPSESPFRKSWLSSSSSVGYYSGSIDSSAPSSPPLLDKPLYASISSTLPNSHVYYTNQRGRSNSEASFHLNHSNKSHEEVREEEKGPVRKTKSGKRKERLQMLHDNIEQAGSDVAVSHSIRQQRWSKK